jgi:predicted AlkP superfamily phosphohydrolase/phosphomutase
MILYFYGELSSLKEVNARNGRDFNHGNLNGNADEFKAARDSAEHLQKRVDQFELWLEENKSDLEQIDRLKLQLKEQDGHLQKLEQAHKTTASERDAAREVAEKLTKQTEQQMYQLDEKDQLLKRYEKIMDAIIEDFKEFLDEEIGDLEDAIGCQQEATATAESHSYAAYYVTHAADIARKSAEEGLKGVREELEKLKAKKEEAEKLQTECTELRRSKDLLLEEKRTKATELAVASLEAKKVRIHNDAVIGEATRLNQNVLKHLQKAKEQALALQKQMHEDDSDFET